MFFFYISAPICYSRKEGTDYLKLTDIGNCGKYATHAELKAACDADSSCHGYSMHKDRNSDATADADGLYPWCLKSINGAEGVASTPKPNHNYYKKEQCPGKNCHLKLVVI